MQLLDELAHSTMGDMHALVNFFHDSDEVTLGISDSSYSGEEFLSSLWADEINDLPVKAEELVSAPMTNLVHHNSDKSHVKQEPLIVVKSETSCSNSVHTNKDIKCENSSVRNPRDVARAARRHAVKVRRAKRKASSLTSPIEKTNHSNSYTNISGALPDAENDIFEEGDLNSKDAKKQRRLIRNRMSAQLHRERKKAYVDQLEAQLQDKDLYITKLLDEISQLKKANQQLNEDLNRNDEYKSKSNITKTPTVVKTPVYCSPKSVASPLSSIGGDTTDCEENVHSKNKYSHKNIHQETDGDIEGTFRKRFMAIMMTMVISVAYFGNTLHLFGTTTKGRYLSIKLELPENDMIDGSDIFSKISATARLLNPCPFQDSWISGCDTPENLENIEGISRYSCSSNDKNDLTKKIFTTDDKILSTFPLDVSLKEVYDTNHSKDKRYSSFEVSGKGIDDDDIRIKCDTTNISSHLLDFTFHVAPKLVPKG